jgi:penicillin-binding protein 2
VTAPTETGTTRLRLTILVVVVVCLFAALLSRLWFLQVVDASTASVAVANNGVRTIYTPAPRGNILDRNGKILVGNVNKPVIDVNRQVAAADPGMVARLAALLGTTVPSLKSLINNVQYSPYQPVPVVEEATPQQILYVQEHQALFPGVTATTASFRAYGPGASAASNLLGYMGVLPEKVTRQLEAENYQPGDQVGLAGVEATYESYLRGTPGVEKVQVNSQGQVLGVLSSTPPVPGHDLRLSIDITVQDAAVSAIEYGLSAAQGSYDTVTKRDFAAPAGAAVVEDPQDGSVLALATYPVYDSSLWVGGISQANYAALTNPNANNPLLDRAIQGQYAPGSTFKLVTATAGLETGLITPYSIFHDTGSIKVGNQVFHNDNGASYGDISLQQAITVSSDNFFNEIGAELWDGRSRFGDDALQNVANTYGFGGPTGIALPDEAPGKIPTPASVAQDFRLYPKLFQTGTWFTGDSVQTAIGQFEVLVTPLQLANAYSAFANGGTVWQPRIALDVEGSDQKPVQVFAPQKKASVALTPEQRAVMLAGFEGVVNNPHGTAYGLFSGPLAALDIAGKTGTAQVQAPKQNTSVFTSFAPASAARWEVTAFMEQSGYGASIAGPVVRQIYDALDNLPPEPIERVAAPGAQT